MTDEVLKSILNSPDAATRGWAEDLVSRKGEQPRRKPTGAVEDQEALFVFIPYPFFPYEKGITQTYEYTEDGGVSIQVSLDGYEPAGPEPRYGRTVGARSGINIQVK